MTQRLTTRGLTSLSRPASTTYCLLPFLFSPGGKSAAASLLAVSNCTFQFFSSPLFLLAYSLSYFLSQKSYCECFAAQRFCLPSCRCVGCSNHQENFNTVLVPSIQRTLHRNPASLPTQTLSSRTPCSPLPLSPTPKAAGASAPSALRTNASVIMLAFAALTSVNALVVLTYDFV